jgi:pimeloyl-ACP methyl ester carboxylesterase
MRSRIYGNSGPTVIVLHGGPGACGEAAQLARGLQSQFVAIEAFQRGSSEELLTVQRHVEDLHEYICCLNDYYKPLIVGESWGAMLALSYASAYPRTVATVALVGCGTFDTASRAKLHELIASRIDNDLMSKLNLLAKEFPNEAERMIAQQKLVEKAYIYDPIPESEQMELGEPFDLRAHRETWDDMLKMQELGVYPAAFVNIKAPVLMLHGDYDPHPGQMIYQNLRAYIPQIEFRELKNCGHSPWRERQARKEFFMLLRNWLLEHTDEREDET